MEHSQREFLWCEKYRPKKIDDCVLPAEIKAVFKGFIAQGRLPHFILSGGPGVGKTTVAKALAEEIGAEFMFINASEESGIDMLRTKIKSFASSISLTDAKKIIILDEADYLNPSSTQPALRGMMEEFSSNCIFIMTCNYLSRIIAPLQSRATVIDFKIDNKSKAAIATAFFNRILVILKQENIAYENKVVADLVNKYFPDFRKVLNELQRYSTSGKIDSGILINLLAESFTELVKILKDKDFTEMRKWVAKNSDMDNTALFHMLYKRTNEYVVDASKPDLVLILAEYQYKAAFVADQEINTAAALTEIMVAVKFI